VALGTLFPGLPNLRHLNLDYCVAVDDGVLYSLARSCPKLTRVQVSVLCVFVRLVSPCVVCLLDVAVWVHQGDRPWHWWKPYSAI
jgi:hypothetical protein